MRFMLQEIVMNRDLLDGASSLARGSIRHLAARPGRRVVVLRGSIWITRDGDPRDIVLEGGESFDFDGRGDALLSAFDDSIYWVLDAGERH
jgi:hypothetical protein